MSPKFFQAKSYVTYWLDAVDQYSLHSPFYFDFYTKVLKSVSQEQNNPTEAIRKTLLSTDEVVSLKDFGAGSQPLKGNTRKISDIARTSLTPKKYAQLYKRILSYFRCKHVVELGTSLGITTAYLATLPDTKVTTFEGSKPIATLAQHTIHKLGLTNVDVILGNIDKTLPEFLSQSPAIDFALLDANHRYEPTLNYFQLVLTKSHTNSVIIIDDIYYSPEMTRAWNTIKSNPLVYGSADLFKCGIIFLDPSLNKQHVTLRF